MRSLTRNAIVRSVEPDLDPDEEVLGIFSARVGPTMYQAYVTPWKLFSGAANRVIVLTTQGLMVRTSPPVGGTSLVRRISFDKPIGPMSSSWNKVELGAERLWIHRRFRADIEGFNTHRFGFGNVGYENTTVLAPTMNTLPSA